ncbi:MAG: hypothetical protein K6E95_09150 [Lachnospiraceae bacterium]|nr:hypothetical protein [Lachnospiraceae bacterium]
MIYFFMKDKKPHEYDDMLDLPYPYTSAHKRMDLLARAKQFAPFAGVGHLDSHDGMEEPAAEEEEEWANPFDDSSFEGEGKE